jgi:rod shape-determining protein MreC
LSNLLRAWYVFLALGLLTFVITAFVGRVPVDLTAAVATPHDLLYRTGRNVRVTLQSLANRNDLLAEVADMRQRVARLQQTNRDLQLQLQRLEEVLSVRQEQSPGVVTTAPVTGGSSGPAFARLDLGKGTQDGVLVNMPVTVPEGLVGIVTGTSSHNAVVRTVLDPQSRVGVSVRGRGGQGIAIGEVGGRIRVTDFIADKPVQVGDQVETSSYGGLFPNGVLVGTVEQVLPPNPNELRRSFIVRPAVDMSTLSEVVLLAPQ